MTDRRPTTVSGTSGKPCSSGSSPEERPRRSRNAVLIDQRSSCSNAALRPGSTGRRPKLSKPLAPPVDTRTCPSWNASMGRSLRLGLPSSEVLAVTPMR
ncbi:hypothetical protein [Macromonas bipunctata]|uniref:hypothetical protein n=1 Tax=Macromonas bipunctata TaxID=183670 RepID=UPI0011AFCB17|nr:hypothetical protein [Macromonas bipunctata]